MLLNAAFSKGDPCHPPSAAMINTCIMFTGLLIPANEKMHIVITLRCFQEAGRRQQCKLTDFCFDEESSFVLFSKGRAYSRSHTFTGNGSLHASLFKLLGHQLGQPHPCSVAAGRAGQGFTGTDELELGALGAPFWHQCRTGPGSVPGDRELSRSRGTAGLSP